MAMRVDEIMTRTVITLSPTQTVADAIQHFRTRTIHHLLVVDRGSVVGVLSIRDVSGKDSALPVTAVMNRNIRIADPSATIRDAAKLMMGPNSGCLPIMESGRLAGIVTTTDLMRVLSGSAAARGITGPERHGAV